MRKLAVMFFRSFLQGLILLSPLAITAYVIYIVFDKIDTLIPIQHIPRGVGFMIIVLFVTFVGFLGTRFFIGKWVFDSFGHILERTPGVKYLYSSVRDMVGSFVGDKKRFNKPVWVCVNLEPETWRIGFMTQADMTHLGMNKKVAVYMPHAYAISGWVIVTDIKYTKPVTRMSAAEAMKFAVSGGITNLEDDKHNEPYAET